MMRMEATQKGRVAQKAESLSSLTSMIANNKRRLTNAVSEQESSKRARRSNVNTRENFHDYCGIDNKVTVSNAPWTLQNPVFTSTASNTGYNVQPGTIEIVEFLAQRLVSTEGVVVQTENESSLYPLVFDVLSSVISLSHSELSLSANTVVARRAPGDDSVEDEEEEGEDEEDENWNQKEDTITGNNEDTDTSNDNKLKPDKLKGYIEFVLTHKPNNTIRAVVMVKLKIVNVTCITNEEGFWQLCAEMVTAQVANKSNEPVYGAFTDGFTWCFCRLQNNVIYASRPLMNVITYNPTSLLTASVPHIGIFLDYLFVIVGLENPQNIVQYLNQHKENIQDKIKAFVKPLRDIEEAKEVYLAQGEATGEATGEARGEAKGEARGEEKTQRNVIQALMRENADLNFIKTVLNNSVAPEKVEAIWNELQLLAAAKK